MANLIKNIDKIIFKMGAIHSGINCVTCNHFIIKDLVWNLKDKRFIDMKNKY